MSALGRTRQLVEYGAARILCAAVQAMGLPAAERAAVAGADLFYRLDVKHRERALRHIQASLPDRAGEERARIARESFRSFALTFVESLWIGRIIHPATVRRHMDVTFDPAATRALSEGRGAVFVTAHLGNWELTGAAVGLIGYPLVSVARPIENMYLNRFVVRVRERLGQKILAKKGALRDMARTLRSGGYLGVLVDQDAGKRGVFVPFLGRLASTTPAPALLALRHRAPLIPAWQRRVGSGCRAEIRVEAPLPLPETGDRDEDVRLLTAAMNARVEEWVREAPEQWLWAHRRWKRRPPAESMSRARRKQDAVAR